MKDSTVVVERCQQRLLKPLSSALNLNCHPHVKPFKGSSQKSAFFFLRTAPMKHPVPTEM